MNRPQPQVLAIWRITLTLCSLFPAFLLSLLLKRGTAVWVVSVSVFALIYLLIFLVYLPLLYKKITYSVSEDRIIYNTGVFYTRVKIAPVSVIQYVSVSQSAIERLFGISSVAAMFAGGRITLAGLKTDDAKRIAELLQSRAE